MGTNFYLKGHRGDDDPKYHIGKRSAAGLYCWDCRITLCKGGESVIHQGQLTAHWDKWHWQCPKCGRPPTGEDLSESAVGRELGLNPSPPGKKSGVRSCSSFRWARKLGKVKNIVDEYGREYTREEFLQMLEECPIRFTDSCGERFC